MGGAAWERVRLGIEQLRNQFRTESSQAGSVSSVAEMEALRAIREVQASRESTARELQKRERELQDAAQEAQELRQEAENQRARISAEREGRTSDRRRNQGNSQVHGSELRLHEGLMNNAARDVEDLWGQLLRDGGLQPWQVEQAERLRREIAAARAAADAKQLVPIRHSAATEAQTFAVRKDDRAAGLATSEPAWDTVCHSLEQFRERFQLAGEQARQAISTK